MKTRRQFSVAALAGLATPWVSSADTGRAPGMIFIEGGYVVDGAGTPARRTDVLVAGDRIVAVGARLQVPQGARRIDASGLVVAPGFIEPHAHITSIPDHPDAESYLRQGVTTIVNSLHSIDQPYPLGRFLAGLRVAPNTVWTAGHTWIRKRVIGLADRAPTRVELEQMKAFVAEAMRDGAIGLGTGLEYIPAVYSKDDEVAGLARVAARRGAIYVTHLRDEGPRLMAAIDEAIGVARAARLPLHIDHIKTTGRANWGRSTEALAKLDAASRSGVRSTFDVYPYTAYSTVSDVLFPAWALADGDEAFRSRVSQPGTIERLIAEMRTIYQEQTGGELASVQFREGVRGFEGRTLEDYVVAKGEPATLDTGLRALIELHAAQPFLAVFHAMDERDVEAFLRHPAGSISGDGDLVRFGEGVPHPRTYGSFPRVLARYVRERGLLTLPAAVHKMTGQPARVFGLVDRGVIRPGAFADLVLFDPASVTDTATFERPHQYPEGIPTVIVNGVPVIEEGRSTGVRPGRVLRLRADGRVG